VAAGLVANPRLGTLFCFLSAPPRACSSHFESKAPNPSTPPNPTVPPTHRNQQDKLEALSVLSTFTIVLTTYGTLAAEAPLKHRQAVKAKKQGSAAAPIDLAEEGVGVDEGEEEEEGWRLGGVGGRKKGPSVDGGPLFQVRAGFGRVGWGGVGWVREQLSSVGAVGRLPLTPTKKSSSLTSHSHSQPPQTTSRTPSPS